MQECKIDKNLEEKVLTIKNYKIELEDNQDKKRVAIYINNKVNYERQRQFEEPNNHLIVLDVKCNKDYHIINLYRSFSSNDNITPSERFKN